MIANTISVRRKLRRRTRFFLLGGFLLLSLLIVASVLFTRREHSLSAAEQAHLVMQNRLADLLSTVRQSESGVRGYMLTGNPASLGTYNLSLQAVPIELQQLDASLDTSAQAGAQTTNMLQIHQLVAAKLAQLAQAMQLYQAGETEAAVDLVNTDLNLKTMQDLRNLIGMMQARQSSLFQHSAAEQARDDEWLQIATTGAVLGTFLLALFAIRENQRQNQQLRFAEAELILANTGLEHKIEQRTRTLRASETQFRTLAESIPGFVFMTDADANVYYINPEFCTYTGLTAEQTAGKGWVTALHPDDVPPSNALWSISRRENRPFETEYRFRRTDGVYRWFLGRSRPIINELNEVTGWIGTATDIDGRKRAEAALAASNATLEARVAERSAELDRIFRLSTDILTISDSAGRFLSLSPAWERITGFTVAEAMNRTFYDYVHPDDLNRTTTTSAEIHEGVPVSGFENRYRRADGGWVWLSWRTVPSPEEGLAYSVARDVTQDKLREEQLRQSQKMEVVGQLTGGIAHDFNNLLTIILGSLELLQRGMGSADPKSLRRVTAAVEGARRAAALTHRLLAFSRRQPLTPQLLEVNRLITGMSDMLHRTLGESIAIEIVTGAGLWPAMADTNQLENAVLNLAVNARDAMPEGGRLTIETQNTFLDDNYAAQNADVQPGQYVQIAVADTGSGMTPEVQAKVFEPFFTTKPQGQGTGLGLAQVYGFIKQSGGHAAIYSEPGHGTTVKLYLPRLRGELIKNPVAPRETITAIGGNNEIILLVEDEEGVRNFSAEVLEELGYHVLAAENAAAALALLETTPRIDILFTDVVLTGAMNGRKLADEVLRRRPDTIVLFTTGYTRNAIIHHGRLDDGINFLGKPFTATALGQTIHRLLQARITLVGGYQPVKP